MFDDCPKIASEAKYKAKYGRLPIELTDRTYRRLPIELTQVKAGDTSENLLNEIRQIIYSLYRAKEITEKAYNSIMNSMRV